MRDPKNIKDYEKKSKTLRENGWTDLWHPDNWVKEEWFDHPTIDIDRAGVSTNVAYRTTQEGSFRLDKSDIGRIHDVVFDVTGRSISEEVIRIIWKNLPRDLRELGMEWGCNDTVFRDRLYEFIEEANKLN